MSSPIWRRLGLKLGLAFNVDWMHREKTKPGQLPALHPRPRTLALLTLLHCQIVSLREWASQRDTECKGKWCPVLGYPRGGWFWTQGNTCWGAWRRSWRKSCWTGRRWWWWDARRYASPEDWLARRWNKWDSSASAWTPSPPTAPSTSVPLPRSAGAPSAGQCHSLARSLGHFSSLNFSSFVGK